MKIVSGIKKVVKPFVNIPAWIGYRQLADLSKAFFSLFKDLFSLKKTETQESFSEAMARLKLTEKDVQQRIKEFKRLVILFSLLSCAVFGYAMYLMWQGSLRGMFVAFAITLVTLAYTFRYHFWLFQVKQRRLGCTLRDWWSSGFLGSKK